MSVVINSNFAATLAANNLASSNQALQRSLNRLSSGSKIVNPADDAGGLAVSMKLSAAARRQGAVANNLGNSTSFLQSQDGVLKTVGKVLERIGELKTLASDPTKNSTDLDNYNAEFTALQDQIESLADETFNGKALFGTETLNVASTEDGSGVIDIDGVELLGTAFSESFTNLSQWTDDSTGAATAVASGGTLTLTDNGNEAGVTSTQIFSGAMTVEYDATGQTEVSFGGSGILLFGGSGNVRLEFDGAGGVDLYIDNSFFTNMTGMPASGALSFATGAGNNTGTITNLSVDGGGSAAGNIADITSAASLSALALASIRSATQDVATYRAENGALQSRLGYAAEVLATNKANLEAASSRIVDVDVASESTQMARYNILVQAGTAMLSQANQSAQSALRLIG